MDTTSMWAIGIIVSLSSGGFIYLLNKIDEKGKAVIALGTAVDANKQSIKENEKKLDVTIGTIAVLSKEVESKPDYKYVNDEFYKKEMAQVQFANMTQHIVEIKDNFKGFSEVLNKMNDKIDGINNK